MPSTTSHSSTRSKNKPPFIPGTPFLSESPAWVQGSPAYVDHTGRPYSSHHSQNPRYSDELRSPIPPAPANLYPGSPAAFNVDPGIPFLATAGPTDAGDSERGSIEDEEPQSGQFVGGFVTGIKKAVRNSLRRNRPTQPEQEPEQQNVYALPPEFRDSGYASSIPQVQGPAAVIPPIAVLSPIADHQEPSPTSSSRTRYSARPRSETLVGHTEDKYSKDEAFVRVDPAPIAELPAMTPIMSPVSADPDFGSDYAQMYPPTPPPSDTSFNTYLQRLSKVVKDINKLPWIAKERVTTDYYPERARRRDEPKRHPAIAWRSEAYYQPNFQAFGGAPSSQPEFGMNASEASGSATHLITPRRRSRATMDLDAEFDPTPRPTPLPAYPPNIPASMPTTPSRLRPPLPADPPRPPFSQVPPQTQTPQLLPSNSFLFSSQAPQAGPSLSDEPDPNWDQANRPPSGMWQYNNENYGAFATPKSATSQRSRRSSRSQNPAQTPAYTPAQPVNTQLPPPRAASYGNPNSPGHPTEWQQYPQERSGYVPYEFSENYYGSQYGPGVHTARPPVAPPPVSGPSSTTSLRQPP